MKIEIEKVQKIKPFEPFIIKIQFDEVEETKSLLRGLTDDIYTGCELDNIQEFILEELTRQGYVI
jgi:hypothetical protein